MSRHGFRHGVKVKVTAFVVVGLAATSWLGARYAGLELGGSGYTVSVTLPRAGGLFENGEVTYRGVPVGRIEKLTPTATGVKVTLAIDGDAPPIPAASTVSVANRSAIGEQYLDLAGVSDDGPALEQGSQLSADAAALPPDINGLLDNASDLAGSVPTDDLQTVLDEGYDLATGDVPQDLGRLLDTSGEFRDDASENVLATSSLIRSSSTVLRTQEESADSIRSYSQDLSVLADTMASSDGDLRNLLQQTPGAAAELNSLIKDVGTPLSLLMSDLVPTAEAFGSNAQGLHDVMVRAPEAISIGYAVTDSRGINMGLVPTFFDPLPCTNGYGGTQTRSGTDTEEKLPLNLEAGCAGSPGNVKGPANLPDPGNAAIVTNGEGAPARIRVADSLADLLGGER